MLKLENLTLRAYKTLRFKEFLKIVPFKLQKLKLEHLNKHQEAYCKKNGAKCDYLTFFPLFVTNVFSNNIVLPWVHSCFFQPPIENQVLQSLSHTIPPWLPFSFHPLVPCFLKIQQLPLTSRKPPFFNQKFSTT
jgi:hypothetical protein